MAKNQYTLADLDWLDATLKQLKGYVDNNPFDTLEHRLETVMSAKGTPVIKIIATKEAQIKALTIALREYITMLAEVDRLGEEKATGDIQIRGGGEINGMMQAKLNRLDNPREDEKKYEESKDEEDKPKPDESKH